MIIITRSELEDLQDRIYVLECAIADIDADIGTEWSSATHQELRDALGWLLAAARPVTLQPK